MITRNFEKTAIILVIGILLILGTSGIVKAQKRNESNRQTPQPKNYQPNQQRQQMYHQQQSQNQQRFEQRQQIYQQNQQQRMLQNQQQQIQVEQRQQNGTYANDDPCRSPIERVCNGKTGNAATDGASEVVRRMYAQ